MGISTSSMLTSELFRVSANVSYDICREEQLMQYLAAFYPARPPHPLFSSKPWTNESHPHKLALIFITLAMGAMSNIDVEPPDMKTAAKYYQAAAACLNVVNFMHENTMACLQTLVSVHSCSTDNSTSWSTIICSRTA